MNIIKKCINSWTYFQKLNCNIVYPKDQKELNDVLHHAKNKNLSVIAEVDEKNEEDNNKSDDNNQTKSIKTD